MLRRVAAPALITAACVAVVVATWAGRSFNPLQLLVFALPLAGVYALAATGLVVVYTTTGVFNFAQGAIGMLAALTYWELSVQRGWPAWLAAVVTVCGFAPALGLLLEHAVMRHLAGKDLVVQLMVTVGLLLGFVGVANTVWDPNVGRAVAPFFADRTPIEIAGVNLTYHRLLTLVVAVVLVVGLRFLLNTTTLGVAMRAVVDNRSLAALAGVPARRVSQFSWVLGSMLAALAAVLFASETDMSAGGTLTLATLVPAFAAAAVGRMRSLPLAYAGALVLALVQQFALLYLSFGGRWAQVPNRIPEVMLFVVLLLLPASTLRFARISSVRRRGRVVGPKEAAVGLAVACVAIPAFGAILSPTNLSRLTSAMGLALIALSLVPLTGWAGQVSFAPLAFAGVGAAAYAHWGGAEARPVAILAATLAAAPVGALLSLIAVRLQGLYLGLATFAFAYFTKDVILNQPFAFNGQSLPTPRPVWFGVDFAGNQAYLVLITVVFAAVSLVLVTVRTRAWGRRLVAMRDSEAASATVGVNLFETKVAVFTLSAAIAGLGGAFLAMYKEQTSATEFEAIASLGLVLQMVVGGIALVTGALFAGVFQLPIQILQERYPDLAILRGLAQVAPGFAALGIIQNPDGAVVAIGDGLAPLLPGRSDARAARRARRDARSSARSGRYRLESAELGLTTPIDASALAQIERHLGVGAELARGPGR